MTNPARKWAIFAGLCLTCAAGIAAYFYRILPSDAATPPRPGSAYSPALEAEASRTAEAATSAGNLSLPKPQKRAAADIRPPRILFRYTGVDKDYGKLAFVNLAGSGGPHFPDSVPCEVVHYATGYGVCLTANRGLLTTYAARIFDAQFKTLFTIPINGVPSRCRVSPDGKTGVFTVFVTGHSYASLDFSTQTSLVNMRDGRILADLEEFAIEKDGRPYQEKDFNFWGVTFTPDSKNFYCTLSSNRKHYLVKGDIARRTGSVIHEGVECPSLSPDGRRIAFKKRLIRDGRLVWQLTILDVATLKEAPLDETRSVDDQLEWFDNTHVLYSLPENPTGGSAVTNVWRTGVSGTGGPEIILPRAYSPAVIRSEHSSTPDGIAEPIKAIKTK